MSDCKPFPSHHTDDPAQSYAAPVNMPVNAQTLPSWCIPQYAATIPLDPLTTLDPLSSLEAMPAFEHFSRSPPAPPPVPVPPAPDLSAQLATAFRIGRYTPAERRLRVERYRQKRLRRNFSARVKYDCRKRIADARTRVRGRFVTRATERRLTTPVVDKLQTTDHRRAKPPSSACATPISSAAAAHTGRRGPV